MAVALSLFTEVHHVCELCLVQTGQFFPCSTSAGGGATIHRARWPILALEPLEQRNLLSLHFTQIDSPASAGIEPEGITVGDFKQDGHPDLATADGYASATNANAYVLLGNVTQGSFPSSTAWTAVSATKDAEAIVKGVFHTLPVGALLHSPFDDLAVVVSNNNQASNGYLAVLLGNGDGTFQQPATVYQTQQYPVAVAVGDFNHDGDQDIAVANQVSATVSIFLGNGNGTFRTTVLPIPINGGDTPYNLAVGDFNHDGLDDLAVGTVGGLPAQSILHILMSRAPGGQFQMTDTTDYPLPGTAAYGPGVAVADFDGDTKLDVAITQSDTALVYAFKGLGDGTFQTPATSSGIGTGMTIPGKLAVGTFNNNGKRGLAVQDSNGISFLSGNGNMTFTVYDTCPLDPTSYSPADVTIVHYLAGYDSVAVADQNAGIVTVFLNKGSGASGGHAAAPPVGPSAKPLDPILADEAGYSAVATPAAAIPLPAGEAPPAVLLSSSTETSLVGSHISRWDAKESRTAWARRFSDDGGSMEFTGQLAASLRDSGELIERLFSNGRGLGCLLSLPVWEKS